MNASTRSCAGQDIKVVHLTEGMIDPRFQQWGGLQKLVFWLVKQQQEWGFSVEIWILESYLAAAEAVPELKGLVHGIPHYNHCRPDHIFKLAQRFKENRVSVLHTHGYWGGAIGRLAAATARVPVRFHQVYSDYRSKYSWRHRLTERLLARVTDRIITGSDYIRRFLVDEIRIPEKSSVLIRHGTPEPEMPPDPQGQRAAFGFTREDFVIGSLSRLDEGKGLFDLINALAVVREKLPSVKALFAGDGPLKSKLEDLARCQLGVGGASFPGWIEEPGDVLGIADAFVLASEEREGFSTALIQAMAARLPIVVTRIGGNSEAIEDGINGILVPPRNPAALAEALTFLLENPEKASQMARESRCRYEKNFRMEIYAERLRHLYFESLHHRNLLRETP